jgi:hypothetical protein
MSRKRTPKDPNAPKKWPTGDYTSGYSKPPQHGKIKPGEVRNPWGPKGKPKPEAFDPFEFAAQMPTTVTVNGQMMEVSAETASQLQSFAAGIRGDAKAHKNIQDERRSRRAAGPPLPTAEALLKQAKEEEQKKGLSGKLMRMLEFIAQLKKNGLLNGSADFGLATWVLEAIADYREKHGVSRDFRLGDMLDPISKEDGGPDW